ncbi:uncharacterized protein STEHIDRAFT_47897, partial [Stereum hirsutum FP-91666 SS1]|uniref:uncharacterized protein n=1 Tax=Stereum hirsutum (strain FP-91666) TaxID=721885 RepID=UPI000440D8E3
DSNIAFQSNDEVQFSIQKKYLKIATGSLSPPSSSSLDSDVVFLLESAETLKILFGFIYPRRHPSLLDVEFGVLQDVAEAAEKYKVYAAMNHCQMCMTQRVAEYGPEVAVYAAKHGYLSLLDSAAPHALKISLGEMADLLPPHLLASWVSKHRPQPTTGTKAELTFICSP